MSILDGLPSKDAMDCANLLLKPMVEAALSRNDLTPLQRKTLKAASQGKTFAGALNIQRPQRDALLVRSAQLMRGGHMEAARDLLTFLFVLQPMDARTVYALALTYQIEGDIETAARLFMFFIGLKATDPDGYLRLAECLLGAREYHEAGEAILVATRLGARGFGTDESRSYAARLKTHLDETLKAAAN